MKKPGIRLVPVPCGLCGSPEGEHLHKIRGLHIVQCRRCGAIYTSPRALWDYTDAAAPVDIAYYLRHYWPARCRSASKVWSELNEYKLTGALLDVGCGFGLFLQAAVLQGWQVRGVEPNPAQAAWARNNLALDVEADLASGNLPPGSFDVITLWDVIEHIEKPRNFLRRCRSLLRPGGALLLKTPNAEGLLLKGPWWLKPFFELYRHLIYPANPWEHVYHFTPQYLSELLVAEGFSVVRTDLQQEWGERVIVGRNKVVAAVRYPLMYLAWRLHLPYEITIFSQTGPNGGAS